MLDRCLDEIDCGGVEFFGLMRNTDSIKTTRLAKATIVFFGLRLASSISVIFWEGARSRGACSAFWRVVDEIGTMARIFHWKSKSAVERASESHGSLRSDPPRQAENCPCWVVAVSCCLLCSGARVRTAAVRPKVARRGWSVCRG